MPGLCKLKQVTPWVPIVAPVDIVVVLAELRRHPQSPGRLVKFHRHAQYLHVFLLGMINFSNVLVYQYLRVFGDLGHAVYRGGD